MNFLVPLKRLFRVMFPKTISPAEELRKSGSIVGEDVDIWSSQIDGHYRELLTIGSHVTITCSRLLLHDSTTLRETGYRKVGKVTIGNNVFISSGCLILPPTYIPNKVIIGANTTIKGILEENSLYVAGKNGMATKVGTYDDYISKHKELINQFEIDAHFSELNTLTKNEIKKRMQEGKTYYIRINR